MSHAPVLREQALTDAFQAFNQLSEHLADSYHTLEDRVADLSAQLNTVRDERMAELQEKERLAKRLETLLAALPAGVVVLDAQGQIQEANPVACTLLGGPLVGTSWSDVIARAFVPRADDGADISLGNGRRVSLSTCPLGQEPGQILLLNDVTETRQLQDRLNQHQRLAAMGEVAASLAHQIRTPLASALLYASHLKTPQLTATQRRRFGERIITRLAHLEHLVNDMLLYARGSTPDTETFAVAGLLDELEQVLEPALRESATRLERVDTTGGATLYGNREMLLSALLNLANNALQAMGEGGRLRIHAELEEALNDASPAQSATLALHIEDNGPGIPDAQQGAIFDPFFTTRSSGTGLGLAVVAAITHAHEGRITLESRTDEGCRFTLHLPLGGVQDGRAGPDGRGVRA